MPDANRVKKGNQVRLLADVERDGYVRNGTGKKPAKLRRGDKRRASIDELTGRIKVETTAVDGTVVDVDLNPGEFTAASGGRR